MPTPTYTKAGTKATTPAKLDKDIFGVEVASHELLKSAYDAYLANGRVNLAKTKTRGLVRGGGRKPWRQKGTGRARFGSRRNPIWRGGGIVFGPSGRENYTKQLNARAKRIAVRQALSLAAEANKIKVVESFAYLGDKTKALAKFLDKVEADGNVLIVVARRDLKSERASFNIPFLKITAANYMNVHDILNADQIIFSKDALVGLTDWLNPKTKEAK